MVYINPAFQLVFFLIILGTFSLIISLYTKVYGILYIKLLPKIGKEGNYVLIALIGIILLILAFGIPTYYSPAPPNIRIQMVLIFLLGFIGAAASGITLINLIFGKQEEEWFAKYKRKEEEEWFDKYKNNSKLDSNTKTKKIKSEEKLPIETNNSFIKTCPECDTDNDENSNFCLECGFNLKNIESDNLDDNKDNNDI